MALVGWVNANPGDPVFGNWADVPVDAPTLTLYLQSAYEQCLEFLPHDEDGAPVVPDPVPQRFGMAQMLQARALYRSALAGDNNSIGMDGMQVTVFPMDWTVKNLLRPKRVGRVL